MKKFAQKCKGLWDNWVKAFFIIFLVLALIGLLVFFFDKFILKSFPGLHPEFQDYDRKYASGWSNNEIDALLYYLTAIATVAVAFVAYTQITKLRDNNESEFLLRIDERWTSKQILKARTIIYGLYLKARNNQDLSSECIPVQEANTMEDAIRKEVGGKILKMSKDIKENENFMYLLNLLDFMETISFFHNKKGISTKKLEALLGESLNFHYQVFKPYIEYKRKQPYSKDIYEELESMIKDI